MTGQYAATRKHRRELAAARARGFNLTTVDGVVVQRRLQGLAVLGWSLSYLADVVDVDERELQAWRRGGRPGRSRVTLSSADRVDVVYRSLLGLPSTCKYRRKVAAHGRAEGWLPPCAWPQPFLDRAAAGPALSAVAEFDRLTAAGVSVWSANLLAARAADHGRAVLVAS